MSDLYEVKAAVLAAKENTGLPSVVTLIFDGNGKLLTGGNMAAAVAVLEGLGVDALGLNCGLGPVQMLGLARQIAKISSLPVVVNPNAGLPRSQGGRTVFDVGPEEFAGTMAELVRDGARVVGGCCGTTPEHLREAIRWRRSALPPLPPVPGGSRTVVASGIQAVEFGGKPVLIGERINPTGKSRLKQALREKDMAYLLGEGIAQQDAGGPYSGRERGPAGDRRAGLMGRVLRRSRGCHRLCRCRLTPPTRWPWSGPCGLYNGKALVNSVNGKGESMGG